MLNKISLKFPSSSLSLFSACPASSLSPHVESVWALLFQNCECQEEGTRNLVAECLGKLTLVNPAALLPRLKQLLKTGRTVFKKYFIFLFFMSVFCFVQFKIRCNK